MKTFIVWLAFVCAAISSFAQNEPGPAIQPLTIGDTVPDIALTNILNYHSNTARLSDFKGKLVILDFWATWCSPCVAALPKLNALQQKFAGQVQIMAVTMESKERVGSFFKKFKAAKDLSSLLILSDDAVISKIFPYRTIPHEVWIGKDGKVEAITSHEYVTANNIQSILDNAAINWPVKDESYQFPYKDEPIYAVSSLIHKDTGPRRKGFYSGISNYIKGMSPGLFISRDTLNKLIRYNQYNFSILTLYALAYNRFPELQVPKRCVLNIEDSSQYIYNNHREYYDDWSKKNGYSYESVSPLKYTEQELRARMAKDLDFFFRVDSKKEIRKIPCLILKQITGSKPPLTTAKQLPEHELNMTGQGAYLYSQKNSGITELVHTLNNDTWLRRLPYVIDETGYSLPLDLELNIGEDPSDINAWRNALQKYGLDLVAEERELEMLVLTEKNDL